MLDVRPVRIRSGTKPAMRVRLNPSEIEPPQRSMASGASSKRFSHLILRRHSPYVLLVLILIALGALSFGLITLRNSLVELGESGAKSLKLALETARSGDLISSQRHLSEAERAFTLGERWLHPFSWLPQAGAAIPGLSHGMTGQALFRVGQAGTRSASGLLSTLPTILMAQSAPAGTISMIDALERSGEAATKARAELEIANQSFRRVRPEVLPEAYRGRIERFGEVLPIGVALLDGYAEHQELFAELLGAHGPRVYLFLFQNNHELRATGGFIGSYALLDVNQGRIRRFFVDGIFNPDGQLKENIVPPKPIQKISAGWSLHDSNWFPDFPTSAEKAIFFYEKTGGPTVDGIITLTPEVLRRILELVGPVELPEYGATIDAENFIGIIQEEVEVKYDREENNPKKILGDLTEVLLQEFLSFSYPKRTWELGTTLATLLNEKHILLYSRHPEIESLIRGAGWSGEVLEAPHDYLSVIHTNINGYKTDGVIHESIIHESRIGSDGRVTDTVEITRKHEGGNTPYEWWNKVNADYLRVYVPRGAQLISAEGMTREFPEAPLDYAALGFRRDPDIAKEEEGMVVDEMTGTRISEDKGKTVFGNWVYVSPGESVTVRYKYVLPFRVLLDANDPEAASAYSVLYQKQSGSGGASLTARIRYSEALQPVWQTPGNLIPYQRTFETNTTLDKDFYWGAVFGRNPVEKKK